MTWMWIVLSTVVLIVWALTLADILRRHYTGWTAVGYIALVVILPFIGSAIYWAVRQPTADEVEQAHLGRAELRRSAASRPVDRSGM